MTHISSIRTKKENCLGNVGRIMGIMYQHERLDFFSIRSLNGHVLIIWHSMEIGRINVGSRPGWEIRRIN